MREMIRVVKPGGYVAFDVLTEKCLSEQIATQWLESQSRWILNMVPKQFVIAQFEAAGMKFQGSFTVPMLPGITEYLVFAK
jgi:hypothetical protein